jgi:tetratricopeptide (TPR) repeat protein
VPRSFPLSPTPLLLIPVALLGLAVASAQAGEQSDQYELYKQAIAAGDLESAVVHARNAYQAAERERGPKDEQTGILAFNLGVVSFELGRYRDSQVALAKAVPIYQTAYGPQDERLIVPLAKLAEAHQALEEWAAAERFYVRAIQIIESKRGRDDLQLGLILGQLAQVAEGLGESKRVRSYGLRAISILTKLDVDDPIAIANLHVPVAHAELVLGNAREARKHTERAVELYESVLARNDPSMLRVYTFAAEIYERTGKDSTARKYRHLVRDAGEQTE